MSSLPIIDETRGEMKRHSGGRNSIDCTVISRSSNSLVAAPRWRNLSSKFAFLCIWFVSVLEDRRMSSAFFLCLTYQRHWPLPVARLEIYQYQWTWAPTGMVFHTAKLPQMCHPSWVSIACYGLIIRRETNTIFFASYSPLDQSHS